MPKLADMLARYSPDDGDDKSDPVSDATWAPEQEGDHVEGDHQQVAYEVMDALKSDDHEGFHEAMKNYVRMCK